MPSAARRRETTPSLRSPSARTPASGCDHVVGARERREPTPAAEAAERMRSTTSGGIASGIAGSPAARHVELRRREARVARPRRARRWDRYRGRSWRRSRPASDRARHGRRARPLPPVSTERAIATIARTEATPSSASAPRIGAPSRIVSAKPSTWRR